MDIDLGLLRSLQYPTQQKIESQELKHMSYSS